MKTKYDIKEFGAVPPPYGGVSIHVSRLIGQLRKDGYSVGGYYTTQCSDKSITKSKMFDKWTWMQTSKFYFKIWKYLLEAFPYKIIHSHYSLEGMIYFWTIKTLGRKKIVVTVHNSMNTSYYQSTNLINRFFLKRMLQSKDVTWITVSNEGKQQLEALPVKILTEIAVIPAYIPVAEKKYPPLERSLLDYIKSHEKIISFYGHSFMFFKGQDIYGFRTAVKIFTTIRNKSDKNVGLVMCIADNSEEEQLYSLHKFAQELGVDDKIFWQEGAIDNIQSLWKETDIYIRPTSTDGDSVAVREVLDEGVTVIASDVCNRPEGVITYKFGHDDELISSILNNLDSPKKVPKMNFKYYEMLKKIYDEKLLRK